MVRGSLGGPPWQNSSTKNLSSHIRVFVFFVSFAGTVVWSSYNAALTSKLVTKDLKLPFRTLEEFLKSDYR